MNASGKKVGLVLGSGASRGWAHIGAIEALEESGIQISMIVGASAGAFIGAAYAAGGLNKVKDFAVKMDWRGVLSHLDLAFPRSGFIEGKKIADLITTFTQTETFEELRIPLKMVATDVNTAEQVILSSGSLNRALRASMGVPGVMTPVKIDERWLVDGGVVNPLPVDVCREMGAEIVVAIDINSQRISSNPRQGKDPEWKANSERNENQRLEVVKLWAEKYGKVGRNMSSRIEQWFSQSEPTPHLFEVLGSSLNIMQKKIEEMNLKIHPPDFHVQPRLGDMKFFDFDEASHAIEEGYGQTMKVIPDLLTLLSKNNQN